MRADHEAGLDNEPAGAFAADVAEVHGASLIERSAVSFGKNTKDREAFSGQPSAISFGKNKTA